MLPRAVAGSARSVLRAIALVLLVSVASEGCTSLPEQTVPYEVVARLKPGVTTMTVAEQALGTPEETEALPDGGEVWLYRFAPDPVPQPPDLPTPTDPHRRFEVLKLVFGPTGLLMTQELTRSMVGVRDSVASSQAEHDALREIPLH